MPNSPEKTFSMIGLAPQESIIMMNANGEITYWNKAAEEMFGWAAEEVIGKNLHELIVPEKYSMSYEKGLEHFYKTGRGSVIDKTVELHARHRNGSEFVIELSLGAIHIHGEWHAIGVVRDVEKKKQLEFQLTHAEKMESVATLAGGIAHDFNNILASIIGFTELAMDDADRKSVV
jgi:PAS domain S-box-containing protein